MLRRSAHLVASRPAVLGVVALALTAALVVPLLTMAPTSSASIEPDGPSFAARDLLDERLAPEIGTAFFVVEAAGAATSVDVDGPVDVLAPDVLRVLDDRLDEVRARFADIVATVTDADLGGEVVGALTIADLVDAELAGVGGIDDAPDDVVAATADAIIDARGPGALGLSALTEQDDDGSWSAPALAVALLLDNDALGGGSGGTTIGVDDTSGEELLREVRDVLRGGSPGDDVARDAGDTLVVHAVAADTNLTAAEQGQAAGPFIGLVVLLTLLLVGVVFRSYWHVAIVGSGLAALMVWLLGISNLVGLEQDQILATVVPIALVSFGVDFAFHALGRVREERERGRDPRAALAVGLAGVGGALLLALASDSAAFLANVFAGIESIVQFGIAAAFGLSSAFLLLGVVAPAVETAVTDRVPPPRSGPRSTVLRVLGSGLAASAAMAAVLLTVYVAPAIGVVLTLAHPLLFVVLPAWLRSRTAGSGASQSSARAPTLHDSRLAHALARITVGVARRGRVVSLLALAVTAVATVGALRVEAAFDAEDFFAADTDFVASLDALDRHVGDSGGEPTTVVVTTDLTDPSAVAMIAAEVDALRASDDGVFAVDEDGAVLVEGGVVDLVRDATTVPAARAAVEARGVTLEDGDGDGIPDDRAALAAVYDVATTTGLPLDDDRLLWAPAQVAAVLDLGVDDEFDATRLELALPGSREVTTIEAATAAIDPRANALAAELRAEVPESSATATGAPIVRQRSLEAVSRALLLSLPIAVVACLLVALVAMRSIRYALVAITPILLVVPWLYGVMFALGFEINLVTGTIGAISVGIGIDFAIHLVERFREERERHADRDDALRATATGTGLALVASAASSVLGFGVLSFAPMPLFASYGLLTAIMVAMALVATLLVLPALLRATTPATPRPPAGATTRSRRPASV